MTVKSPAGALLTERFDRALAYASALHRQQVRKGSNVPTSRIFSPSPRW